ncbi:hypothetical protein PIB30_107047, partial [Stylosanthes scabra]|nr:hypothetical protein [Stylosanthes scabra]
ARLEIRTSLDTRCAPRMPRQLSKLEPVPEKSDNIRSENPQPMDSHYGQSAKPTVSILVGS